MPDHCSYIFTNKTCGKESHCDRPTFDGGKYCIFHTVPPRNMMPHLRLRLLFAILGLSLGIALVLDQQNSETALWILTFLLLAIATPFVMLPLAITRKWKILLHLMLVPALIGFLSFHLFNLIYWPSNIRVGFGSSPGGSGSYHIAQFSHKVDGEWIEGPRVESWPMTVSFPDLNADGHKDIRVVEENSHEGDSIEFVFVPDPSDGIYWKPHRMDSRLRAAYEPSRFFHNYP